MWGNPFPVGELFTREEAIAMFRICLEQPTLVNIIFNAEEAPKQEKRFWAMREHLADLKDVDHIACFCKEGELCHGDVIIEEAERINKD